MSLKLKRDCRAAIKRLAAVEADSSTSHQHEFNGTAALRRVLGAQSRKGWPARWVFLSDFGEPRVESHECSWYDAREGHPTRRAEWRLYYYGDPDLAPGDLMALLKREGADELLIVVAPAESTSSQQLLGMFGAREDEIDRFVALDLEVIPAAYQSVARELMELAGWLEHESNQAEPCLEDLLHEFPDGFPSTRRFSEYARDSVLWSEDLGPDQLILAWWQKEDDLFRALEEHELLAQLKREPPFEGVDEFMSFSLSIQNRRKSRAGHALENHFEALLNWEQLSYTRGAASEGSRKPDFLLPGISCYRDLSFPQEDLTMIGVKTSCKDRWRQILSEAKRTPQKHLLTLEPAISTAQLREMGEEGVILVAPEPILATYAPPPETRTISVQSLINEARRKQRHHQRED